MIKKQVIKKINLKKDISNKEELINYLKEEDNSYSDFILSKLDPNTRDLRGNTTQLHHIIPLHQYGPNHNWNLILLTIEEHAQAHQLLYDNYQNSADLGASQMIRGQVELGWQTIRKIAIETRRRNQSDFFSSEIQQELGKRPKKRRASYARNTFVLAALERGFDLSNSKSGGGSVVKIGPCECSCIVDVVDKLMSDPLMENQKQNWRLYVQKQKHPAVTILTRMLTGHIDKRTGKRVFSYQNWRILGINISID